MKPFGFALFWILAFVYFEQSSGCGRKREGCFGSSAGYGFQFGTQNLSCVKGKRKRSPSRATGRLAHRYIKYRGVYYEFMPWGTEYGSSPYRPNCRAGTESYAAGYGVLSTECVKGCAKYFGQTKRYSFGGRNCHHFANWLANILCKESSCPSYCERYM
ncbi:unnamed protein product [Mytilus coruscus]|uniref:WSC domain-containing protein n=1 Tax=Mytilus coruscus TaxID=42192 RepID=A0A6J8A4A3_MYTCO|nr:unnamed protein product [Mytilus coruscus]